MHFSRFLCSACSTLWPSHFVWLSKPIAEAPQMPPARTALVAAAGNEGRGGRWGVVEPGICGQGARQQAAH